MTGRTIRFSDEASFLKESGKLFLDELQQDAASPDAPDAVRRDWATVTNWLGHTAGGLSQESRERLGRAWVAYLAIGLAPSAKLQSAFEHFALQVGDVPKSDRPPTEVMDVFDRLLATDADIASKRSADLSAEEQRLRPIFENLKGGKQNNWWRRQLPIVRNWLFVSGVWIAVMFLYAFFFDPFDVGGWDNLDDEETARFVLVLLVPLAAGALYHVYHKWVK